MQGNFSSVDSLMMLHQFEAGRKVAFVEGQLKEKEACGFATCFAFCLLLKTTFLLQVFATPTLFTLYSSKYYLVLLVNNYSLSLNGL